MIKRNVFVSFIYGFPNDINDYYGSEVLFVSIVSTDDLRELEKSIIADLNTDKSYSDPAVSWCCIMNIVFMP